VNIVAASRLHLVWFKSNGTILITEIHTKKVDLLHPMFQGRSKSSELTRINRLSITSY